MDGELGPILEGKVPVPELYIVKNGVVFAKQRQPGVEEEDGESLLVVVPRTFRDPVLYAAHEAAGHFGINKTRKMVAQHFFGNGQGDYSLLQTVPHGTVPGASTPTHASVGGSHSMDKGGHGYCGASAHNQGWLQISAETCGLWHQIRGGSAFEKSRCQDHLSSSHEDLRMLWCA